MSTLPKFSAKTIREIQAGKRDSNGRKKVDAKEVWSAVQARDQKQRDLIFGTAKPAKNGHDARRIAKARAWAQFSMFIRLRDADEHGITQCCTCPARKWWRSMDAGHYVTTAKEATKFDENNVHAQCKGCNKWQGGKPVEYEQFIDRKYGTGTAEKIRIKSVKECKRLTRDYIFLEDCYRQKVQQIKANEPGKFKKP